MNINIFLCIHKLKCSVNWNRVNPDTNFEGHNTLNLMHEEVEYTVNGVSMLESDISNSNFLENNEFNTIISFEYFSTARNHHKNNSFKAISSSCDSTNGLTSFDFAIPIDVTIKDLPRNIHQNKSCLESTKCVSNTENSCLNNIRCDSSTEKKINSREDKVKSSNNTHNSLHSSLHLHEPGMFTGQLVCNLESNGDFESHQNSVYQINGNYTVEKNDCGKQDCFEQKEDFTNGVEGKRKVERIYESKKKKARVEKSKEKHNKKNASCATNNSLETCSFLYKYNLFIKNIESLLLKFLKDNNESNINVSDILYGPNLPFLSCFDCKLLDNLTFDRDSSLNKISSVTNMLSIFFKKIEDEQSMQLIYSLKQILMQNYDLKSLEDNFTDILLDEIIVFLKSTESQHFKGTFTVFYSFELLINEIKKELTFKKNDFLFFISFLILIKKNDFLFFISFLILIKKSDINYRKFKEEFLKGTKQSICSIIIDEEINCSAFLLVFVNNFHTTYRDNIFHNLKMKIYFNCVSKNSYNLVSNKIYYSLMKILKHIFFDLRKQKVLNMFVKIFNVSILEEMLPNEMKQITEEIETIEKSILENRIEYWNRIESMLVDKKLQIRNFQEIKSAMKEKPKLLAFSNLFEIVHRLDTYKGYNVSRTKSNRLRNILK